jgi:hypothetical protein
MAERLIATKGRAVTLYSRPRPAVDASRPWRKPNEPDAATPVTGVFLDFEADDVDGELVKRGDQRLLVAEGALNGADAGGFDRVEDAATGNWSIVSFKSTRPGDTAILHEFQLRR